jgi:small conductance mechanosensitive channel
MGSKDLVTDMLAGIFLMFEGAIHVGDIVEIGGYKGRVTDMGIRTCFITDENNDVKIITNSRVSEVVNKSLAKSISSIEIEIERDVEFEEVEGLCAEYIASAKKAIPEIATTLDYAGVVGLTDSTYKVRLVFACNEPDRETLTAKLVTTMQLILENARGRGNDAPEGDESPETKGTSE